VVGIVPRLQDGVVNSLRKTFLDTAGVARGLLANEVIARKWDEPSALEKFRIRGLTGHLVRATTSVTAYLDRGPAGGEVGDPLTPAEYYARAVAEPDIDSDLHRAIRDRGEREAENGHAALLERFDENLARLAEVLESEPESRLMRVHLDMVLRLDDYLVTRIIELVVHIDDLAVSVELPTPDLPTAAYDVAIDALVGVGRVKHGELAVLRALSRRERDDGNALRVL
jgi:Mycothiol maleylpyruvate isomerase N-terminal domain